MKQLQKKLVKINPVSEQRNSCPPIYPGEQALGIYRNLAFASPHVSDTLSDSGHFTFCFDLGVLFVNPPIPNHKG